MIAFSVDPARCIACGACVRDCLRRALRMENAVPVIDESLCMGCQHCLAVCPTGAVSMQGHGAEDCLPLRGRFPDPEQLETLIRGRRSVRRFRQRDVDPGQIERLLATAAHAPTASNRRGLHLTVLDSMEAMNAFREETYRRLTLPGALARLENSPRRELFTAAPTLWKERGEDRIFHGAPHCIIVSNHRESGYNLPVDPIIFLTTFELAAQTCGVGTLWCGLLHSCLEFIIPEFRDELGIPETHAPQYAMLFGYPDVSYPRSVLHDPYPVRFLRRTDWSRE